MLTIFRAVAERVRALFVTDAALEFEAELLTRQAERRAHLLRLAARYEIEGFHDLAQNLRRQADTLSTDRPLAGVLPAVDHLFEETIPLTSATAGASEEGGNPKTTPALVAPARARKHNKKKEERWRSKN